MLQISDVIICHKCKGFLEKTFECCKCHELYCYKCIGQCIDCNYDQFRVNEAVGKIISKINICLACGKKFSHQEDLKKHKKEHKTQCQCIICDQQFNNSYEFNKHINSFHFNIVLDMFNKLSIFNIMNENLLFDLINQPKIDFEQDNQSKNQNNINNDNSEDKSVSILKMNKKNIKKKNDSIQLNNNNNNNSSISYSVIGGGNHNINPINEENNLIDIGKTSKIIKNSLIHEDSNNLKEGAIQMYDLFHCGKKVLKCNCCDDKICRKGNCFCINCMKQNIQNLIKEQSEIVTIDKRKLFNKEGRIATLYKGKYYCNDGSRYEGDWKDITFICGDYSTYQNFVKFQCKFPRNCKACEDLNKNLFIYNEF